MGHNRKRRFISAIEPWHGNQVVVYHPSGKVWSRTVIDPSLVDGHTIITADLDGDGTDEIIAGFRGTGRSVYIYKAADRAAMRWNRTNLDNGGMAAAACTAADLNGDKKIDIVCIGSETTNLKWYENVSR